MDRDEKRIVISRVVRYLINKTGFGFTRAEKHLIDFACSILDSAFLMTESGLFEPPMEDTIPLMCRFTRNIEAFPNAYCNFYRSMGEKAFIEHRYEDAVLDYTLADAVKPCQLYLSNRACAFLYAGYPKLTIMDCKLALWINNQAPEIYETLGFAYCELKQWDEAWDAFNSALSLNPLNQIYPRKIMEIEHQMLPFKPHEFTPEVQKVRPYNLLMLPDSTSEESTSVSSDSDYPMGEEQVANDVPNFFNF